MLIKYTDGKLFQHTYTTLYNFTHEYTTMYNFTHENVDLRYSSGDFPYFAGVDSCWFDVLILSQYRRVIQLTIHLNNDLFSLKYFFVEN